MLFCRDIRICCDLHTFLGDFGQKKCLILSKTVILGQKLHLYMVYIAYCDKLKLQICNCAQKRRICGENSKYAPDENCCGHFCPRRKTANFCHPATEQETWLTFDQNDEDV